MDIYITNLVQIIMWSFVGHRGFCWLSCKRVNTIFGMRWRKYGWKLHSWKDIFCIEKRNKIWMVNSKQRAIIIPFHARLNMSLYTLKVWQVYDTLNCFILLELVALLEPLCSVLHLFETSTTPTISFFFCYEDYNTLPFEILKWCSYTRIQNNLHNDVYGCHFWGHFLMTLKLQGYKLTNTWA